MRWLLLLLVSREGLLLLLVLLLLLLLLSRVLGELRRQVLRVLLELVVVVELVGPLDEVGAVVLPLLPD